MNLYLLWLPVWWELDCHMVLVLLVLVVLLVVLKSNKFENNLFIFFFKSHNLFTKFTFKTCGTCSTFTEKISFCIWVADSIIWTLLKIIIYNTFKNFEFLFFIHTLALLSGLKNSALQNYKSLYIRLIILKSVFNH